MLKYDDHACSDEDKLRHDPGFLEAKSTLRWTTVLAISFGCVLNIVQLGIPIYSMQIFDRVIPTGHLSTLAALTVLLVFIVGCSSVVDATRSVILARCGQKLNMCLEQSTFEGSLSEGKEAVSLSDLDLIRSFITSPSATSILDLPWTAIYLFVLFLISPTIGIYGLACLIILTGFAWFSYYLTRARQSIMQEAVFKAGSVLASIVERSELLTAMGMLPNLSSRLLRLRTQARIAHEAVTTRRAWIEALTRAVRSIMQVGILALVAVLVVLQEVNAGAVVASTMVFTRTIAPVERLASSLSTLQAAWKAWHRIVRYNNRKQKLPVKITFPSIEGLTSVENVSLYVAKSQQILLENLSFTVRPSKLSVIVGAEGAGKSTLARLICGAVKPTRGCILLDGMNIAKYNSVQLSQQVGYLPQTVLFKSMTVAQFISRQNDMDEEAVVAAARLTGADLIIRQLADGYQTVMSFDPPNISVGQLRRISLASAIYKLPKLLVFDEPTLGLDDQGENEVVALIKHLKQQGCAIVVVSRSPKLMHLTDELLFLKNGRLVSATDGRALQSAFGPREITN